jgi:tetratricopeptide (TPR) repeat protein
VRLRVLESRLLLARGEVEAAESAARRALQTAPGDAPARLALAAALAKGGRGREAGELWLALVEESPDSPEARKAAPLVSAAADAAMEARDFERARRGYQAVLDAGRVSEALFLNLALATWRLERRDEALAILERGRDRFPGSADLHYRVGRLQEAKGRRAEAESSYRRALQISPGRADAQKALARLQDGQS